MFYFDFHVFAFECSDLGLLLATGMLGKQEVHSSEAPKRSLRELQEFLFRFPRFCLRELGFGPASGHRDALKTTGSGPGRPRRGRRLLERPDSCTNCKGSGRPIFRAPQLSMEISCPVHLRISLALCLASKSGARVGGKLWTVVQFARETEAAFLKCYDSSRKTGWGPNKC